MDGKALREKLSEARGEGGRVPAPMQLMVVKYSEARREAGASMKEIGEELGISWHTLSYWRACHRKQAGATLARVNVVDVDRERGGVVVHGPGGLRIEGLSLLQLAELIARLR